LSTTVTLSVKSQDPVGITYADPAKPDTTIRFRFSNANKVLNGVSTPNYASEYIINDNNSITVGGVSALDALSIRLRVSGSLASKARLRNLLVSLAAQLGQWDTENVNQGFRPVTAPTITTP
jgi:hypothetical protein